MAGAIPFTKMNGLGNDFVVVDARANAFRPDAAMARALAERQHGVGCDQLIIIEPAESAAAFMRIVNADGSEAAACGNATRCIALLLAEETGRDRFAIETAGGLLHARVAPGAVAVEMGAPRFGWADIPLAHAVADTGTLPIAITGLPTPAGVSVGNPHSVFFVEDPFAHVLETIGPAVEHDALFPQRTNVSLAAVSGDLIILRVWERGAGMTRACGTAACAAAAAAMRAGLCGRAVTVRQAGGDLAIAWPEGGTLTMTGPAMTDFAGAFEFEAGGLRHWRT